MLGAKFIINDDRHIYGHKYFNIVHALIRLLHVTNLGAEKNAHTVLKLKRISIEQKTRGKQFFSVF